MGTRGAIGFYADGKTKATYNHSDSYPGYLGIHAIEALRNLVTRPGGAEALKEKVRAIRMVEEDSAPSQEDIKRYEAYANITVGKRRIDDWYCLLRSAQGNLEVYAGLGIMIEGGEEFLADSLFCEWAYIVNLDEMVFEVYRGFQKEPHNKGRYSSGKGESPYPGCEDEYYPCALLASFPIEEVIRINDLEAWAKFVRIAADEQSGLTIEANWIEQLRAFAMSLEQAA